MRHALIPAALVLTACAPAPTEFIDGDPIAEPTITIVPIVEPDSAAITVPASRAPERALRRAGQAPTLVGAECDPDAVLQGADLYCP